jgi:glycosyltransferase involved in cell wall biosynthesis
MCADLLKANGYKVVVQLPSLDPQLAAELVSRSTGIPIEIAHHGDYLEAIRRFGAARIHIGLSISDGISQSLLESMVMGAFPIQSCTACTNEWIEDGESGFIVPPEDPHIVAEAIRRAITDDDLVNRAVAINDETARQRLAYANVKENAVGLYNSVFEESSQLRLASRYARANDSPI